VFYVSVNAKFILISDIALLFHEQIFHHLSVSRSRLCSFLASMLIADELLHIVTLVCGLCNASALLKGFLGRENIGILRYACADHGLGIFEFFDISTASSNASK